MTPNSGYENSLVQAARVKYKEIVEFLRAEWSQASAETFVRTVNKRLDSLLIFPFAGVRSEKRPEFRKLLLTRHNMLVYQVRGETIFLHDIYDTRRDPSTINV